MRKSQPRGAAIVDIDLARLPSLPLPDLHALWRAHSRSSTPPPKRRLLVRELAYMVQTLRFGGLDAETRRRLDAAVRAAVARSASGGLNGEPESGPEKEPPAQLNEQIAGKPRRRSRSRGATPVLPPAARLVRVWNGRRHEVEVVDGGRAFIYLGSTYRSLTAVARAITGTEWSTP